MTRDQTIPPGGFSIAGFLPLIGVIVGLLWGWALPVFVFFWFGREAVRAEVHTWR